MNLVSKLLSENIGLQRSLANLISYASNGGGEELLEYPEIKELEQRIERIKQHLRNTNKDNVLEDFEKVIKDFEQHKFSPDDELAAMYKQDAADLRVVLDLMRAGKFKEAEKKAWNMDTAARDWIPDAAWELIT